MEPRNYTVIKIEGEYATLKEENGEELFIALALLPEGTDLDTKTVLTVNNLTPQEVYN